MNDSSQAARRVLLLHPDAQQRQIISDLLTGSGYELRAWDEQTELERFLSTEHFHVAVMPLPYTDARIGSDNPLTTLRNLRKISPSSQIVALVATTVDLATCCQAVSLGVASFVEVADEIPGDRLLARVRNAAQRYEMARSRGRELHTRQVFDQTGFAGQSKVMADLLCRARQAARVSDAPVLVYGESGTGKQLLAEAIHRLDPKRSSKPFISVNCAAITDTLAESTLFGHARGAFTGATGERLGHFRAAHGGTILLDEIGDLPLELQPKLLRALQANRVMPVGADREIDVDVRVIAATNLALEARVGEGRFRLDLYQRLNVIRLELPALRHRPEDVPPLFRFFLNKYASYHSQPITRVNPHVYTVVAQAIGDGNVRELENLVRRILVFKQCGDEIDLNDLPADMLKGRSATDSRQEPISPALAEIVVRLLERGNLPLGAMLDECEKLILEQVLTRHRTTNTQLARKLGITRRTLYNKLAKYHLSTPNVDA